MMDRLYCTLSELIDDLDSTGIKAWKESQVMDKIGAASEWIDRNLGQFIPTTETRRFDGSGLDDLWVDPLLAVITIVVDSTTLQASDYLLYPRNRHWDNGPYTRIASDPNSTNIGAWPALRDCVAVTGRWGMYERSVQIAAVSSQLIGDMSLSVSNGAAVSPGMVLLIDDEQEVVTATGAPSDSAANLNGTIDANQEEITLDNAGMINPNEILRVDFEQMRALDTNGNLVLVSRGYNGTKRTTHNTGADVYVYRTYQVTRGVNGTMAAAHSNASLQRYVAPDDVNGLCRQMAALMLRMAQTGFSGRVGNAETGEVSFYKSFPSEIEKIRQAYTLWDI